jgi:hypothetical protein
VRDLLEAPLDLDEKRYKVSELASLLGFDRKTVTALFLEEPGVIRLGHPGSRRKRQYYSLRVPHSVAQRVISRLTVNAHDKTQLLQRRLRGNL